MKQIIIIIIFSIGALLTTGLVYGQKIYKDETDRLILDCSADSKMQQNAVTDVKKYTKVTMATVNAFILGDLASSTATNAQIYYKLEIAPKDICKESKLGVSAVAISWAEAYNNCKKLNFNGTGWRLPTQRELMMMWIYRDTINSLLSYWFVADLYWSATEGHSTTAWYVNFDGGNTFTDSKRNSDCRVRCVREITE